MVMMVVSIHRHYHHHRSSAGRPRRCSALASMYRGCAWLCTRAGACASLHAGIHGSNTALACRDTCGDAETPANNAGKAGCVEAHDRPPCASPRIRESRPGNTTETTCGAPGVCRERNVTCTCASRGCDNHCTIDAWLRRPQQVAAGAASKDRDPGWANRRPTTHCCPAQPW